MQGTFLLQYHKVIQKMVKEKFVFVILNKLFDTMCAVATNINEQLSGKVNYFSHQLSLIET